MNLLFTVLLKDYGSDAKTGLIALGLTVLVYIIWFALNPDSASKSMEGNLKRGERGLRTERNRKKRHNTRRNQINRLRSISEPNSDGQYIYIFQSKNLYKVGISNNVEYRRKQIQKKLNDQPVVIHFIGKVRHGRTIDGESIIHQDLSDWNVLVEYNDGTASREWFRCSLGKAVKVVSKQADLYPY